jgi:hypothetical protein
LPPRRTKDPRSDARPRPEPRSTGRANHLRVVQPFPPAGDASRAETGPTLKQLRAVLAALAEVTATSLAYLRLATDMPGPLLGGCVEALAPRGLRPAEDPTDGHPGPRTVPLTPPGRRAHEALEDPADFAEARRDAGARSAEPPGGAA